MTMKSEHEDQKCVICLMGFEPGEETYWMQCAHRFHQDCIDNLAAAHKMAVIELRCPTCKTPSCSDEDALMQLNRRMNTIVNLPEQPMQAINLEDTQEYPPGDSLTQRSTQRIQRVRTPTLAATQQIQRVSTLKDPTWLRSWKSQPESTNDA